MDSRLMMSSEELEARGWKPIDTVPLDKKIILGWCNHEADPYHDDETGKLTTYGAHAEALYRAEDGPNVLIWGGEYVENDWETGNAGHVPDWWFVYGSNFEVVANPTHWLPVLGVD